MNHSFSHGSILLFAICSFMLPASAAPLPEDKPYEPEVAQASDAAEQAIGRFRVPDGFKVELVAAEPMLANPVAFALDERGRFFVAETFRVNEGVTDNRRHMNWLVDDLACQTIDDRLAMFRKFMGKDIAKWQIQRERLRLVADTDGDGKADKSTVFSDKFGRLEDGIAAGALAIDGNIYFTCIPDLWLLKDKNDDGVADSQESLGSGFGIRNAFYGHDMHGLALGPDGKIYFSIGDRGMNVKTIDGRQLTAVECGSVVRCNLDGSEMEIFATGLRNPQELAFDDFGNLFTGDNNSDSGDRARIVHIVEGGDSGWRMPYQYLESPVARGPWNDERLWHPPFPGQAGYIVPPIANFADGPSGLAFNPGIGLPAKFDNQFLLVDFRGGQAISGIRTFSLKPKGAGFELDKSGEFTWQIVATDIEFGYDGAVYVLDWVEGWDKTGKGRIYRYYHPESRAKALDVATLFAKGFDQRGVGELIELLHHADRRVRQRAQFALAKKPGAIPEIEKVAKTSKSRLARLHSIWALGQAHAPAALVALLTDDDAEVRAQSAKTLGDRRHEGATDALIKCLADESPRVKFLAAIALGRIGNPDAASTLLRLARENDDADPFIRHAVVMGLTGIQNEAAIERASDVDQPLAVRHAASLVYRKWNSPKIASFLEAGPGFNMVLAEEAARAIYDLPTAEALPALAPLVTRTDLPLSIWRRSLYANARLADEASLSRIAQVSADANQSAQARTQAMNAMIELLEGRPLDPMIGFYRPLPKADPALLASSFEKVSGSLLSSSIVALQQASIDLVARLGVKDSGNQLVEIFQNTKEEAKTRAEALRALVALEWEGREAIVKQALVDERKTVQAEARRALAKLEPKAAVTLLAEIVEAAGDSDVQESLITLAGIDVPEVDALFDRWLDRLAHRKFPANARLDLREAARKRKSIGVVEKLKTIEAERAQLPLAERFADCLGGGDADRGSKIFYEKTAVACLRCHKINDKGGEVGPELSKIASLKSRDYILEALVDPNKTIAQGFDSVVLLLLDGKVVTGVLKEETDSSITVMDAEGKRIIVPKDEIDEREKGKSAMPEDVPQKLTEMEIRDLVEFLATRG